MPRRSRIIVPNIPLHIIQRGNNRQPCFFADEDYLFYLEKLEEYAKRENCLIHSFVLMTNHVHLLLTPCRSESAGMFMKRLQIRITGDRPRLFVDLLQPIWYQKYMPRRSRIIVTKTPQKYAHESNSSPITLIRSLTQGTHTATQHAQQHLTVFYRR